MSDKPACLAVGLSPAIQKTLIFKTFEPGKVNRSLVYYTKASGKCVNVCRVLTQGGMKASCLTIAGRENRREFEELCAGDSLTITVVETSGRVRTCTTLVEQENNRCSEIAANEPESISPEEEAAFQSRFLESLSHGYKGVILSGSRPKGFSSRVIPFMVEKTKEQQIPFFADYQGMDLKNSFISEKMLPDYIKINQEEFFKTFGPYPRLESGLREISSKYNSVFVVSRGPKSTLIGVKGKIYPVESKGINAVNPIGCGDAMTAGMAQGIIQGLSLKEAVEQGRDYAARCALSIHPGWIKEAV